LSIDHEKEQNVDIEELDEVTIEQDRNDYNDIPEEAFKHTTLMV